MFDKRFGFLRAGFLKRHKLDFYVLLFHKLDGSCGDPVIVLIKQQNYLGTFQVLRIDF